MTAKKLLAHPVLLFWIGVLTGAALVIGLLFVYRHYGTDMGANLLRSLKYPAQQQVLPTTDLRSVGNPPTFMPQDTVSVGNPPTF